MLRHHHARSLLIFALFTVTAMAMQLAAHFAAAADAAGQTQALLAVKATLFCIASGVLTALDIALVGIQLRDAAAPAR